MRMWVVPTTVGLLVLNGCAVSRAQPEALPLGEVQVNDPGAAPGLTQRPEELGCPHTPPVTGFGRGRVVILDLRVLPDGSVDPAGVSPVAENDHREAGRSRDSALIEQAKAIAIECKFNPALADGKAVSAVVRKRFYFNTGSEQ